MPSICCRLLALLLSASFAAAVTLRRAHHRDTDNRNEKSDLICRIISVRSTFRQGLVVLDDQATEYTACIPIIHGIESDEEYHVQLPKDLYKRHFSDIQEGRLFIKINGANMTDTSLDVTEHSRFRVVENPSDHTLRRLSSYAFTKGQRTMAIVRVSTNDAEPEYSLQQLQDIYLNNPISVRQQLLDCSFGKLELKAPNQHALVELKVNADVKEYESPGELWTAANLQLKAKLGVEATPEIADRVVFCLPPSDEWNLAGVSSVNTWKIIMQSEFCGSFSGVLHELGHTMGLSHSNVGPVEYGDTTGNMGYGQPYEDGPLKCFNAQNHHQLEWFSDKVLDWDASQPAVQVEIAAFVDYDKANNTNQYVIGSIDSTIFLQYNRAKAFNSGTQMDGDMLTIVEKLPCDSTLGGTDLLAAIDDHPANNRFTFPFYQGKKALIVEVCESRMGSPDVFVVSIGLDVSLCSKTEHGGSVVESGFADTDKPRPATNLFRPLRPKEAHNSSTNLPITSTTQTISMSAASEQTSEFDPTAVSRDGEEEVDFGLTQAKSAPCKTLTGFKRMACLRGQT